MTIFTSKDPAGRTALELGMIFTGLAVGGMNADRLGQIAKNQAVEIARLRAQVTELQSACSQRQRVIERLSGRG